LQAGTSNGRQSEDKPVSNRLIRFKEDLVSFLLSRPLMIVHHLVMAFVFIPLILIRRNHEPGADLMIF
jgi:hypothetical protein